MDDDDAGHRAGKAKAVEDAGDVDVDRHRRKGLRQQEHHHDQAAQGQPQPRQRVAGRDRAGERDGDD